MNHIFDPRFKFLCELKLKEVNDSFDFLHIDYIDGEQVITVNKDANYGRILFTVNKGQFDTESSLYLTSLIIMLRYVDGTVNNVSIHGSIYADINEAKKEIKEEFEYMKSIKDLDTCTYDIIIDDIHRCTINLDQLDNRELTDYDIVAWRVECCRIVR